MTAWVQTYKGRKFNILFPEDLIVDIEEIAHALSMKCRYGGHCEEFYSVAEHSDLVSRHCKKNQRAGLLHDAAEAYLPDLLSPQKTCGLFEDLNEIEGKLLRHIFNFFGVTEEYPDEVRRVDKLIKNDERQKLMVDMAHGFGHGDWGRGEVLGADIRCLHPKWAKGAFLKRARELGIYKVT